MQNVARFLCMLARCLPPRWDSCDCTATAYYNCCLPASTDCRRFCFFYCFFFVLFNFVRCPCNVFDTIVTLISTFLLTYLCSVSYLFLENPDTDSARPISRCRLRVFHYAFCNCLVTGEWQQNFRRHASHRAASLRQLNILLNEHYYLSHFGFWFFFEFRSINQSIYLSI